MASQNPAASETEENEEAVISMVDYLREEEELQNDADAVLGDSDEDLCTYPLGYKSRQAVYACVTCTPADTKEPAGICLACSYACHEGHELLELYTKRNFCCDCGNAKFSKKCELFPTKRDFNTENQYNQNFMGVYCICSRPYPDPEDDVEDEMIQCVLCEDWHHFRHLGGNQPVDNFQEMICPGCMEKHSFLWAYTVYTEETQTLNTESSSSVDVETVKEDSVQKRQEGSKSTKESNSPEDAKPSETEEKKDAVSKTAVASKSTEDGNSSETVGKKDEASKPTGDTKSPSDKGEVEAGGEGEDQCFLKELRMREVTEGTTATYWLGGFRSKLCLCPHCKAMYAEQKIEFLTDQSDTVNAYESRGAAKKRPQEDKEQQVLAGMSRVQQIEMVQGFNDMKSELSEYLKKFAENGKVVRSEDIQEFFQQMQARKRQKTDHTPSYFCR